ncbi:MAG TPA: CRTAC1 family protein [Longimicrobiales bacterium]|nr:CRTAC1 family protein [Longimicrobiales bacterium]
MKRTLPIVAAAAALSVALSTCAGEDAAPVGEMAIPPDFVPAQPELFSASGAQPNTWADYDLDGDLDLFVGFRGQANRLYRNDATVFVDVAAEVGLADEEETRAAAWGDYDMDGDLDLYVGFAADAGKANRLYRNDPVEGGRHFTDVAPALGLDRVGTTRQPVFVDWDGDGDQDLFVAFRDQPNRLYRNEGDTFTDITDASGAGDPRRTVGAVWFDMDGDSDLDLFTANQNGDEDGVYLNQGDGTFEDVAAELGMNQPGRTEEQGSVGVAVADYDNDGDLDLFVASYGPDVLWQNQGGGTFVNVAGGTPLASDHHSVAAAWADYDNDGWVDLYVDRYLNTEAETPDALFRNVEGVFEEVTPPVMLAKGGTHGVAWADFDADGDVDLALANNSEPGGTHPLYVNRLPPARAGRSLQVLALDSQSRWIRAGAEITVRQEMLDGSAGTYQSTRLMEAGGGYSSQGAVPVHFGLPQGVAKVSVTVAWFERGERRTATVNGVELARFQNQWLVLRLGLQ